MFVAQLFELDLAKENVSLIKSSLKPDPFIIRYEIENEELIHFLEMARRRRQSTAATAVV